MSGNTRRFTLLTSNLEDRSARNQAYFRELNERVESWNAMHKWENPSYPDWACECARPECVQPVRLTIPEYEAVRVDGTHFFVVPSDEHVFPEIERVVERHERYWVVEKVDGAAAVSDALDPRSEAPEQE